MPRRLVTREQNQERKECPPVGVALGRIMSLTVHNSDVSDGWERDGENDRYSPLRSQFRSNKRTCDGFVALNSSALSLLIAAASPPLSFFPFSDTSPSAT